jgi:hypothetical protein
MARDDVFLVNGDCALDAVIEGGVAHPAIFRSMKSIERGLLTDERLVRRLAAIPFLRQVSWAKCRGDEAR